MSGKISTAEIAKRFAVEYRDTLSWRPRSPRPGEPFCWFVVGRLDEYGISARDLCRAFLKNGIYLRPKHFGYEVSDERVYEILDRAKKILAAF